MKLLKRVLITIVVLIMVLLIGGLIYIDITLPNLPKLTNKIIDNALKKSQYELKGETGYAINDSSKIWYERIKPQDTVKGHVLLIMGVANDAMAWPDYFIEPIVDSGYAVIRFDPRGTGKSDWFEDWTKENAYSLEDIADDIIAIIDTLEVDSVHILGISFGGMIGQTVAINYPERVATLISISSTGDIMDPELPGINLGTISKLVMAQIRYGLIDSETNQLKLQVISRVILSGSDTFDFNLENMVDRILYNMRDRNGYNPDVSEQHLMATRISGSRYDGLNKLKMPTLVIHGKNDPLIPIVHGKKTFNNISHVDSLWIDGMGHDIPLDFNETVITKIIQHLEKNKLLDE